MKTLYQIVASEFLKDVATYIADVQKRLLRFPAFDLPKFKHWTMEENIQFFTSLGIECQKSPDENHVTFARSKQDIDEFELR